MKQEIKNGYLNIALNTLLAIGVFFATYKQDRITTILLVILLILPPIVDNISLIQLQKINPNLKKEKLDKFYDRLAFTLYIAAILIFVILFKKMNVTVLALGIILYVYANTIRTWGIIRYDLNTFIHRNRKIDIRSILHIDKNIDKKTLTVKYFNNTKTALKFHSIAELEKVERILKRK